MTNIRRKIGPVNASSRKIGALPITARTRPTNSAIDDREEDERESATSRIPARATSSAKPRMSRLRWNELSASARAARISSRRRPVSSIVVEVARTTTSGCGSCVPEREELRDRVREEQQDEDDEQDDDSGDWTILSRVDLWNEAVTPASAGLV